MFEVIYIAADNEVFLEGMEADGTELNAGTATWSLKDATTGTEVTSGNGSLTYVASSDGDYVGVIPSSVTEDLVEGRLYWIDITFAEDGDDDFRRLKRVARYREEE